MNEGQFNIAVYVSHITANRSVKDALITKLKTRRIPQRISVTDLLNLKQAYFRRKHPEIVPSLERQQLMWAGTGFHDIFGSTVSSEEYIEQFVEYEGVVGRIDIYEDIPIEIKTTSKLSEEVDLPRKRPSYIEQLGIYCAMVEANSGKIVVYQREVAEVSPPLLVYDVQFPKLQPVKEEINHRRSILEKAISSDDSSQLPRCPWYHLQCDYSSVCDCAKTTNVTSYEIVDTASDIRPDKQTAMKLIGKLGGTPPTEMVRVNDIVFPRKAYFARLQRERLVDKEAVDLGEAQEQLVSMERRGLLQVLRDALQYGGPGEVQRVTVNADKLGDRVLLHQGIPTIVRATGLQSIVERDRLPDLCSHYFLRLGFECALTNNKCGRLVLFYRNVQQEDAKLMVYDISFNSLDVLKSESRKRVELLQTAGTAEELPACPAWMFRFCKYAPACGCGSSTYL